MANEKQGISVGRIQTQLNELTNLLPLLADGEHPAGQVWAEIQQGLNDLTRDLDRQEMLIDQRIEQVITLHNISAQLGGQLDLPALLSDLAQYSAKLMDADASIVKLVEGSRQKLPVLASYSKPDGATIPPDFENSSGKQVSQQVIQSKQSILANDWPNHPLAANAEIPAETENQAGKEPSKGPLALLVVPVISQNDLIGTIEVLSFAKRQAFDENDLHVLSLLADHAATAIKNTQLFNRAENNYRFLKTVIEHIPDPIFIKDKDHTLIEMNQANAAIIGRSEKEIIGKTDHDFFPPELADKFRRRDDQVFSSNELFVAEDKTIWGDGQEHIAYTRLVPMPDASGRPQYLLGITHDVTERKVQELEQEQLLAETTALYEGSQAISGALSERQIFNALFEQLRHHDPCEISAYRFHVVDEELLWAELVANRQKMNQPTYPEKTRFYLPDHAQARLLTTRKPIFIDDIATDSRLTEAERAGFEPTGACSVALLPLATAGQQIGTVLVYFTKPYRFTDTVRRLWVAFLDQVSVSLLNQQFIQKSAYRAVQMDTAAEVARVASSILDQQDLLATTVALIRDRFDLYYVGVFLIDETEEWAVLRAGTGEAGRIQIEQGHRLRIGGESMIGWAVQNRQPRIALDVGKDAVHFQNPHLPKTRSEMALPLIHRGKIVGALTIQSIEQAAFSREDIIFLQTMADQLAVAIENARLFSQVQTSEATTRALLDAIPDLMFRITRAGIYLDVKAAKDVRTVVPAEEFVGRSLVDILPPDVAAQRLRFIEKTLQTGEPQIFEYGLPIDGRTHYFEARMVVSGPDEVLVIIRDITERRQAEKIQNATYEVSKAANFAENLDEFFQAVHTIVGELMPAENFYVALYNETANTLTFPYYVDRYDLPPPPKPQPFGSGATEYVIRTGAPLLAAAEDFEKLKTEIEPVGSMSVEWLGVPLQAQDKTIGVLSVQSYTEGVGYNEEAKNVLTFVANQVAMVVERMRAEEAVQTSEARYRELVENANSIIFRMNTTGEVIFFNEFAQRFFGYSEAEIVGKSVIGTIVPETDTSGRDLTAMIKDLISNPERYAANENENMRRNGERVWVAWTNKAIFDENQQLIGILCVGNDITERRQAEQALRNSEALYVSLVESLPQYIFRKDLEGRFTFANQRYCNRQGKSLTQIVGQTDFDLYPQELAEKYAQDDQLVVETEQILETVEERELADGTMQYMWVVKTPSYDANDQIIGIQAISWDVTERKQMEDALATRERYMAALVEIQTQLLAYYDVEDYYPKILEALGQVSNASRIYIFENHQDRSGQLLMSQKSEWCAAGIKPQIDNPIWQNLPYGESLPRWAELLQTGETISSSVDTLPESERVILEPQGVLAVLILPLIVNGEFFGFIGLDNCVQKRTWEQSEIDLLLVAAAAVARWHERRLAREALAYERDLLQTLMDNSPDHIFFKDRQSRLVRTNKAHAQLLLGMVDPRTAINKTDFDFFPEEEAQKFYEEEQHIMETGQPVLAREWEVTTSAGVIAWMSEHKLPLTDESGQVVGLMGLARDITARKQAEQALAEERNLLRTLIDTLPDYIYAKDTKGRFLLANKALAHLMNVETPDELVGKRDADFYPSDLAEQYRADEQAILDLGQPMLNHEEPNFDHETGRQTWTATTKVPLRDTRGQVVGLVGVSHDITERKLAEQELQDSRHRLRTILEAVQAGIVIIDAETREVVDANPAALQMMAVEREKLIGMICHQHICPAEWGQCPVCDLGQEVDNSERVLLTTHGETVPILKNVVPVTLGGRRHLIESFVNITERKQAEEALQEALRKSQLLFNISEALTTMTDRRAALETVLGELILLLNLSRGNITLFDPATGRSQVEALYLDHKVVHPESAVGTIEGSLAEYLMENPFPLVIDDVASHPLTKDSRPLQNVKAMLLIPMITSGEVIGAMSAEATTAGHTFSQEDVEASKAISDQLAIWLENRQLVDETAHRSNLLVTGAQVSAAASSILDLDELINRSVNLIRDQFDFYYVGLFLVDRAWKWAVLRAGTGDAGRIQIEKKHRLAVGGESMIGWAVQNRQARIALDVGEEAVHFQNPFLPDTRSEMALPLISRDEVIGALTVQSVEQNAFTEEDITVLQTMADQLANAIANARLFDNVMRSQKAAETLLQETQALQQLSQALAGTLEQDEILALFFQACTQEIGFEYAVLSLVDQDKNVVQAIAGVGITDSQISLSRRALDGRDIMADIVRTGKTEVLSGWDDRFDREMYQAEGHADWVRLFTPIILRRESIGLVEAGFNKSTQTEIKDSQIRLLRAFIDQTALALDNAQRYEASLRAARREALIKEITTKVRASTELDDILQTTVKEIGDAIGGKRTYVHLGP